MSNVSFSSIIAPVSTISATYYDSDTFDTITTIAVKNIITPMSDEGVDQSLHIASSSNIKIESKGSTQLFMRSNSEFEVYQSEFGSGTRVDTEILAVGSGILLSGVSGTTINTGSSDNPIWVYGSDASHTTWISSTQVRDLNAYSQFATSQTDGFILTNQVTFSSNSLFYEDVYMKSTLEVDGNVTMYGNVFSKNLNLWQDLTSNDRVGFGFSINSNAQLELVKYALFQDGTSLTKKVAVFGASPFSPSEKKDDPQSFLVFDQLSGIGMHSTGGSSSNTGFTNGASSSGFKFNSTGNVTTSAYLGIGVTNPTVPLEVNGAIDCTSLHVIDLYCVNITTTSDERLKNIHGNVDTTSCLDKINQLDVINFSYKSEVIDKESEDVKQQTGLRAQQVSKVMADAVIQKSFAGLDDCNMIDSSVMMAYVVGAIKELDAKLRMLKCE